MAKIKCILRAQVIFITVHNPKINLSKFICTIRHEIKSFYTRILFLVKRIVEKKIDSISDTATSIRKLDFKKGNRI